MDTMLSWRSPGFTLIEALIVIVIIGILAAIAIPMYLGSRSRAKNASAEEGARTILLAVMTYVQSTDDNPFYPCQAMRQGVRKGVFAYEVVGGPRQFKLSVHLADRADFVVP